MKKLVLITILILNLSGVFGQWQKGNGPYGGIVQCLTKSDTYIVAGCNWNESGVFVSADLGNTWSKVVDTDKPSYQIPDVSVNAIVQGGTSDVFYVGSSGEGIYKLLLNNGTWELRTIGFRSEYKTINSVAYSKGNLFLSIFGDGIYKTSDEGQNWNPINNGLSTKNVVDLKIAGDSIFAGTTDGLYLSKNNGADWSIFSTELTGKYVTNVFLKDTIICLGVFNEGTYSFSKKGKLLSKPVPNGFTEIRPIGLINGKLYGARPNDGLYTSDIPAINWQKNSPDLDGQWPHCIIDSKDTLLAGVNGFGVYKSKDKGLTWKESSVGISAFKYTSIAEMGSLVYVATDINGVFLTKDNGKTWQRINKGLGFNTNTTDLLVHDSIIYLAANAVYISNDKGANWQQSQDVYARSLTSNDKSVFAACFECGINYTNDKGKTWQHLNFADSAKLIYDIDARDSILLIGTHNGGPYYSANYGKSWFQINQGLENLAVPGVLLKDTMFFITTACTIGSCGNFGVFRSSNYGKTWEPKNNGLCCIPTELIGKDSIIFGAFPQTVIYSTDNGDNWNYTSNISSLNSLKSTQASQQANLQTIGYNKNYLYAGTDGGFFYHDLKNLSLASGVLESYNSKKASLTNYPNPFSEQTTINYTLENEEVDITLSVYDYQGRVVYTLHEKNKSAGNYSIPFGAEKLTSGIYFYNLKTSRGCISNKMIIIR